MEIEFRASPAPTLGVEMELSLVDRESRGLVSAATELLTDLGVPTADVRSVPGSGVAPPRVKHELFESTLEIVTGVCTTVADARRDLAATLAELREVTEARRLVLCCAGTHPFSHWREQHVSPSERYAALIETIQWPARRLVIFGVHFHVGVSSGPAAVAITNALGRQLPLFLALSASSPYWHGLDTGMASCRTKVFESLPTAGLPPRLDRWTDFERLMQTLVNADAIESVREIWWDVRPHPDFGTVELRMCDGLASLDEVASLAALAQSLVAWFEEELAAGRPLPEDPEWVVRQNKWLAARYGVDAQLIVDDDGARRSVPELVRELVALLAPTAAHLGCRAELEGVDAILEHGPSYVRQRRVVDRGGSLEGVVDSLVGELMGGVRR